MARDLERQLQSAVHGVLALCFLGAIWLPLLDTAFGLDPAPDIVELRVPAPWPEIGWKTDILRGLPTALDSYYDDHFGFRRSLIRLNNRLRLVTAENTLDTEVIVGKNNWLYVNAGGGLLDDHRGVRPYTGKELEAYALQLVQRRNLVAALGSRYLFVLAPDKHSIYPEFLPTRVRRAQDRNRTDQLIDHLTATTDLEILDLRVALDESKSDNELYPSNGSHWNDFGAYIAYAAIQQRVAHWYAIAAPFPLDAFKIFRQRRRGDLGRMLSLQDHLRANFVALRPTRATRAALRANGVAKLPWQLPANRQPFAYEIDDPDLPQVVVFRDSFCSALVPFLAEHYRRSAFYWTRFNPDVVRHERPELVIEERSERLVTKIPDTSSP